jgi:hypothetical protein
MDPPALGRENSVLLASSADESSDFLHFTSLARNVRNSIQFL